MRMVFGMAALSLLASMVNQAQAVPVNLVQNGSFETYDVGTATFTGWTNGGTTGVTPPQFATPHPTNGTSSGQYGDVVPQDPFTFSPDPAGMRGAYFVADAASQTLTQTVVLTAGTTYEVGFDLFATLSGDINPNFFTLTGSIGNQVITTATAATTVAGVWQHVSQTFVAPTGSETFTFTFTSGPTAAKDVIVDLVYVGEPVTPVPEPATVALLGAGLLGIGALRRRT